MNAYAQGMTFTNDSAFSMGFSVHNSLIINEKRRGSESAVYVADGKLIMHN